MTMPWAPSSSQVPVAFCAGMDLNRAGNVFGLNEALNPTGDMVNELTRKKLKAACVIWWSGGSGNV